MASKSYNYYKSFVLAVCYMSPYRFSKAMLTRKCFAWLKNTLPSIYFCIPRKHYGNFINLQAFEFLTSGLNGNEFIRFISSGERANARRQHRN